MTYTKLLGYGLKCDTSETDTTKLGNDLFSSFKTTLNSLCKTLPIIFTNISATLYSLYVCLMRSHMINIASLALMSGCIWLSYRMSSSMSVLIDPSSESSSIDNLSIEAEIDSYYSALNCFLLNCPLQNVQKL